MRKEQILNYIDVYNATPADKRKSKIAEIADGLGLQPWEVAETLKAAGCSVNLQWFNQQKRKANAGSALEGFQPFSLKTAKNKAAAASDADEKAADAAAAAVPANVAYLKKIIDQQDKQLRRDVEVHKEQQDREQELIRQIKEKDAELAKKDAEIRSLNAELFRLG